MRVPISNVGQFGVNQDIPAHRLPANAWTDARGVRLYDNAVWKALGQNGALGTPTVDPYYLYHHLGPSNVFWAYPGLLKIYATDGSTHADITRAVGGDYGGSANDIWQGTHLGGIEIFNNGIDIPQAWINPALGTPVVDLANWPAATTARVLKSFKQYLIAMDVTTSGTHFPFLVKWSHVADPGTVPTSWDETDPTLDAGENPLAESGGHILDGAVLQDTFMIYKEDQTYAMSFIGGRFIFQFRKRFNTGVISPRCIVNYRAKHYVATAEDIIVHDGFQQESLLDDKMRRWYDGQADPEVAKRQYMVFNEKEQELWMCIPRAGQEHPDIALIVNLKDGTQTLRDLDNPTFITAAPFDPGAGLTTYDSQLQPYDETLGVFGQRTSKPGAKRLMGSHRIGTKRFLLYDEGLQDEGSPYRGYIERASMPIAGIGRDGQPVMDATSIKQINEIWPEITQQGGTGVDIWLGGQDSLNDPITWQGPRTFDPSTDDKVDFDVTGRYISIRFETTDNSLWKLDSYAMNLEVLGQF
jgi:hypothetical protein